MGLRGTGGSLNFPLPIACTTIDISATKYYALLQNLFPYFSVSVQEVGVSKPTFMDLLPFKMTKMLASFCGSLPEQYQSLLEYWRERRKEKVEEEEEEDDDDEEMEGSVIDNMFCLSLMPFSLGLILKLRQASWREMNLLDQRQNYRYHSF